MGNVGRGGYEGCYIRQEGCRDYEGRDVQQRGPLKPNIEASPYVLY